MQRDSDTWYRALRHRYRELEEAGHTDGLLTVVFTCGALALAGIVLFAFVQTFAVLIIAFTLTFVAVAGLLVTILAMLGDDQPPPPTRASDSR